VTGANTLDLEEVAARVPGIRQRIGLPVGVGFGIRDAETAKAIARFADAVVIGSRIIQEMEEAKGNKAIDKVVKLLKGIRAGMDAGAKV
jgi:tryptophan synthase alpha chain